jgi:hypothetical protein
MARMGRERVQQYGVVLQFLIVQSLSKDELLAVLREARATREREKV